MLAAFIDFKPYYLPRAELVMLEHAFDAKCMLSLDARP